MSVLAVGWMLTEGWPLDHDPQWPARWSPASGPRPSVVYLDQSLESDVMDFLALATALPFVDFFVADKKTFNLATRAKLDARGGGKVLRTLRSLCDELQTLV